VAFAAEDDRKLSVRVAPRGAEQGDAAAVDAILRQIAARSGSLLRVAVADEQPDVLVLIEGDGLYLRPSLEAALGANASRASATQEFPSESFGPFTSDAAPASKLARALAAIAKATTLRRMATGGSSLTIGDPYSPAATLEIRIERRNRSNGKFEAVDAMRPLDVYDDDQLRVLAFSRAGAPVDVTILYVESAFRIRSYFPTARQAESGFNNRITPGGEPATAPITINDSTIGLEDVIVIAALPEPGQPPQNFAHLAQAGARGSPAADLAKSAVHRLSWTVHPRRPPEQ
jgi:hypothetical protein